MQRTFAMALLFCCACAADLADGGELVGTLQEGVLGGKPTPEGRLPYVGGIFVQGFGPQPETSCTGTLIAPKVVLTAAHCIVPEVLGPEVPGFTFVRDTLTDPVSEDAV